MCGIVAAVEYDGRVSKDILNDMTSALDHRGPDGSSVWISKCESAGLGHTRLAVIDLHTGDQPIHSEDGRYSIVLNGEIYNYKQLRSELSGNGYTFRTQSDTEVLLASFQAWGSRCLDRLNGMFAFAIFDSLSKSLFVARDRTGIKPLYVYRVDGRVIVASEIKALLQDKSVRRRLNPKAVADLLVLSYCRSPDTFYADVRELAPGTWCRFGRDEDVAGRYWSWHGDPEECSFDEAVRVSRDALVQSVEDHLVSDVPVGAFLSSGIDSSLVCAVAARELGYELKTFTVGFDSSDYDESPNAKRIARHLGTQHRTLKLSTKNLDVELLLAVIRQFDQPFGDSSAVPTFVLSSLISEHVKVVLSGDGGDEMFGGYPRFLHADVTRLAGRLFGPLLELARPLGRSARLVNPRLNRTARRLVNAAGQRGADRLTWLATYVPAGELETVLSSEVIDKLGDYRPSVGDLGQIEEPGADEFMDITVRNVLPNDYLRKTDIASSAHGIEVRVPFLGNQVLDCAQKIPKRHKFRLGGTKLIPRALLRTYLPDELCNLPKSGFNIPLMKVLSDEHRSMLAERLLRSACLNHLVSPRYIGEIARAFSTQVWDKNKYSEFMIYQRFYALLTLVVWIDERRPEI